MGKYLLVKSISIRQKVFPNLYFSTECFQSKENAHVSQPGMVLSTKILRWGWVKIGGYRLSEIALKNFLYRNGHIGK
jgi:hypothetical protein